MKSIVVSCDWHNVGKARLDMSVMTSSYVSNRNIKIHSKNPPEAYIEILPERDKPVGRVWTGSDGFGRATVRPETANVIPAIQYTFQA